MVRGAALCFWCGFVWVAIGLSGFVCVVRLVFC